MRWSAPFDKPCGEHLTLDRLEVHGNRHVVHRHTIGVDSGLRRRCRFISVVVEQFEELGWSPL